MTQTIEKLPDDNEAATLHTLRRMAELVRGEIAPDFCGFRSEAVRRAALDVTKDATTEAETIQAWFEFVRDGLRYVRDPYDTELVQDPCSTLELRAGDCDDRVVLLCAGLLALGYLPRFVAQHNGAEFSHVYAEVVSEAAQSWIALDPTGDGKGLRPLLRAGERVPAQRELRFDLFTGEAEQMSNGMGAFDFSGWGNELYQSQIPYDPNLDWYDLAARGIDVAGATLSHSPYVSPDDPRYRANNTYNFPQPYPQPYPQGGQQRAGNNVGVGLDAGGVTARIPTWAWALGGALVAAFLFGQKRGR